MAETFEFCDGYKMFIARLKATGMHVLIWLFPDSKIGYDGSLNDPIEAIPSQVLNSLLRADNAEKLLDVVSMLRPQFQGKRLPLEKTDRILAADVFLSRFDDLFCHSSREMLAKETVLTPFASEWTCDSQSGTLDYAPSANASAAGRAVEKYGFSKDAFMETMRQETEVGCAVCVEPLQEWLFTRGLLSICASICALQGDIACASLDEALGLVENKTAFRIVPKNKILKKRCLIAPFMFNPFFRDPSKFRLIGDAMLERDKLVNPFREAVTGKPSSQQGIKGIFELHSYTTLKGFDNVAFMTGKQAAKKPRRRHAKTSLKDRDDLSDDIFQTSYILYVDNSAEHERLMGIAAPDSEVEFIVLPIDESHGLVESLGLVIQAIHYACIVGPHGSWGYALGACSPEKKEEHGESVLGFASVPSALWETLTHHQGYGFVTCARCKNTVLVSTRGAKSKYCSNSCRSAASRERKNRGRLEAPKDSTVMMQAAFTSGLQCDCVPRE